MKRKLTEKDIEAILSKNKILNSENELLRIPMEKEAKLLDTIRRGNYREVKIKNYSEIEKNMGRSAKDRRRHFEYNTVAGITMATRAAIDGGLRPDDAYDIGDTMLQLLEQAKTITDMHHIFQLASVVFAKAVNKTNKEKSSYLVERCKVYISRNILKKMYLEEIAEYVGVHPSYLSRLFSKKEGITIQQYIQNEKLEVACNMLKFSDYTVAEVSQYIGFQSQSYFSSIFKKLKSMSPLDYRNKYKKHNFSK